MTMFSAVASQQRCECPKSRSEYHAVDRRSIVESGLTIAYGSRMASPSTIAAAARLLVAEGVGKRFGDNVVLRDVNLAVAEREVVCVIGPSGSGKTTLLRCMALLEAPREGRILMDGAMIAAPANAAATRRA